MLDDNQAIAELAADEHALTRFQLDEKARSEPGPTFALCEQLLEHELSPTATAYVRQARGMAQRELGDPIAAAVDLELAIENAALALDRHGSTAEGQNLWAQCALSLASARLQRGQLDEALALAEQASERATGDLAAHAKSSLGTGLAYAGRLDEAFVAFDEALVGIEAAGRVDWQAYLFMNRAVAHMHAGNYDSAVSDSHTASRSFATIGNRMGAAMNRHNEAVALFLTGKLADSLTIFAAADAELVELGVPEPTLFADKSKALLAAGFFAEALDAGVKAAAFFEASGGESQRLEALVAAAEAAFSLGELEQAGELARSAQAVPGADRVPGWIARAILVELRARLADGSSKPHDVEYALALVESLETQGQGSRTLQATLLAAQLHIEHGAFAAADALVATVSARVDQAPFHEQLEGWALNAQLCRVRNNAAGTLAAVERGLALTSELQAATGSFVVRLHASQHAQVLLEAAVATLVEQDDLPRLVSTVEQVRGRSLNLGSAQIDPELQRAISELRRAERSEADPAVLVMHQQTVRDIGRRSQPSDRAHQPQPPTAAEVATSITWIQNQDEVLRIVVRDGDYSATGCGRADHLDELVQAQAFCGRQLARRHQLSETAKAQLQRRFAMVSEQLAELLLPSDLGQRVVLNPVPRWNTMAWAALPGLSALPHVLAPASDLLQRTQLPASPQLFAAGGSDLPHVPDEVTRIAAIYRGVPAIDPDASALSGFSRADIAHLAGHFVSRSSDQLFTEVQLGPSALNGHDVLAAAVPNTVILSACSSGRSSTVGDAALGFSTAVLAQGASTVVHTTSLVEDSGEVVDYMVAFHELIAAGDMGAAEALAQLRSNASETSQVVFSNWNVLGRGW